MSRTGIFVATLLAAALTSGSAGVEAALLGLRPDFPMIVFHGTSVAVPDSAEPIPAARYDASIDLFEVEAAPVAIRLAPFEAPIGVTPDPRHGELLFISAWVDETGALAGDAPGYDLVVAGAVDLPGYGLLSGVLLTGEAVDFGHFDSGGPTDDYDFRFRVTGGELEPLYRGRDVVVSVNSEGSDFTGDFTVSFSGKAKGTLGATLPVISSCEVSVDKTCCIPAPPVPSGAFACAKPIDAFTLRWDGAEEAIRVKAWKGAVGSTLLADVDDVRADEPLTVSGYAGSPNDVVWELFLAGTDAKVGESIFHLSCSDDDMDGAEDCRQRQGDGKGKSGYRNDWLLEGMVDSQGAFDCTP